MKYTLVSIIIFITLFSCKNISKKERNLVNDIPYIVKIIKDKDSIVLKTILSNKNVNNLDSLGISLLSRAVLTKDFNIVKILIDKGANPNKKNKTKMESTPLMLCSGLKNLKIANFLLKNGASIDTQDKNGDPAINWSAYYGNIAFTNLMLEKGARVDQKSIHSDFAIQVALKEYKDSVVDLFIKKNHGIHKVKEEDKPILKAIKENDLSTFKSLINKNNINTRDEAGNTLLIIAANKDNIEIIKFMVKKGVAINAINSVGQTALNKACYLNNNEIAEYLINKGADVNKVDNRFMLSPLVAAIKGNNTIIGKVLLDKGSQVNTIDGINHFSPLMWAVVYENIDFVSLILKYNPNKSLVNKYGEQVIDMTHNEIILKLLKR